MKKLFILIAIFFCSCTATDNSITKVDAEIVQATLSNGCYVEFMKFTYEGHDYLTDYGRDFVYHLPSCSCYNKVTLILDTDSSFESNRLFDN